MFSTPLFCTCIPIIFLCFFFLYVIIPALHSYYIPYVFPFSYMLSFLHSKEALCIPTVFLCFFFSYMLLFLRSKETLFRVPFAFLSYSYVFSFLICYHSYVPKKPFFVYFIIPAPAFKGALKQQTRRLQIILPNTPHRRATTLRANFRHHCL